MTMAGTSDIPLPGLPGVPKNSFILVPHALHKVGGKPHNLTVNVNYDSYSRAISER